MKRIIIMAVAGLLLGATARAEVLHNGKVYQVTADRLIVERQLACSYGQWRFETSDDGRTVIIRDKVCTREQR